MRDLSPGKKTNDNCKDRNTSSGRIFSYKHKKKHTHTHMTHHCKTNRSARNLTLQINARKKKSRRRVLREKHDNGINNINTNEITKIKNNEEIVYAYDIKCIYFFLNSLRLISIRKLNSVQW